MTSAVSADTNISYTYNHDGIRTSKTVNGTIITYKVDENNNVVEQTDGTNTVKFAYDSDNSPIYMVYNGVIYYYEKNLQGDIVALLDSSGDTVVEYSYDIWGKLLGITGKLADTLGTANPLRYRGYYYDTETGLYYLQSRYYAPDLMQFISQDDPFYSYEQGLPLGSDLYTYCLNNPANYSDNSGLWAEKYSGFKRTSKGFNVNVNLSFLSRSFCVSYALDIIRLYGSWYWWGKGYKSMGSIRIAQEIWFHAIVYYIGSPVKSALSKFHVSWGWLNSMVKSARYIEVNNDDSRAWVFSLVWWSAYSFKTYIRLVRGCGYPFSYIHI